jgi:nucleotide-binding universal stress UspA family protein
MTAVAVKSESGIEGRRTVTKPHVIVVATDGTPQSDPAIAFTRAFADRTHLDVRTVSVVDHLPMPWGVMDRNLVAEYEHALRQEAREKTNRQLSSFGLAQWPVEIQGGDPATRISAFAKGAGAWLVVLGLGEHGAAARLFGSETALRLARVSQTPVLAIAPNYREAPRRILVAMDFSEASIEAARLALELAAKDATIVLAHVVPWERKEYVPEDWFRSHESSVGAELTRVTRWLDASRSFRIVHRILYGKPASTLLSCADELESDLIVAGSHSRSIIGRALAGQTIPKLIRGARCSVLVIPAGVSFRGSERLDASHEGEAKHDWVNQLDEFSKRNLGRRTRLEVDDVNIGAQAEMSGYRFLGATYEPHDGRASLMFGDTTGTGPHLVRGISKVKSVDILRASHDKPDVALAISHSGGQTLLVFNDQKALVDGP